MFHWFDKSVWLHLRIPFSFFLMPIFCFALSQSPRPGLGVTVGVFLILHLLLYPASNAYNSYYDKDEGSIGGLEHPPPVGRNLLYAAWLFDLVALLLGLLIGWQFALGLFVYGAVSKAYSHDQIRIKKYPVWSWLVTGVFQGAFTYLMVYQAINNLPLRALWREEVLIPAGLSTLWLMAAYPMTQIYQHEEDARRGDLTLSRLLGIQGTFVFTATAFLLVNAGFFLYFHYYVSAGFPFFLLFQLLLLPVLAYFFGWFVRVRRDRSQVNFRSAMRMNLISAVCMNLFFLLVFVLNVRFV
ncbi:MAG: UbiA prenyltransferase family protein [Ferruginibacter sp.]|nr:UbiA prenyltransferase family protein [Cytophagales bacterium]